MIENDGGSVEEDQQQSDEPPACGQERSIFRLDAGDGTVQMSHHIVRLDDVVTCGRHRRTAVRGIPGPEASIPHPFAEGGADSAAIKNVVALGIVDGKERNVEAGRGEGRGVVGGGSDWPRGHRR